MKLRTLALSTLAAAISLVGTSASAATITYGTQQVLGSGALAPGSEFNYDFTHFGGGKPTVLTDFTVSTAGTEQCYCNGDYTTVIAPGQSSSFLTGIAYNTAGGNQIIATFTTATAASFSVWILDGNTDGINVGNTSVGLSVNGGAAVTKSTIYSGGNEFTRFDVRGATSTDVFEVHATGSAYSSISGLTFDNVVAASPVPEPSSISLCFVGLGAGVSLVRRRLARA